MLVYPTSLRLGGPRNKRPVWGANPLPSRCSQTRYRLSYQYLFLGRELISSLNGLSQLYKARPGPIFIKSHLKIGRFYPKKFDLYLVFFLIKLKVILCSRPCDVLSCGTIKFRKYYVVLVYAKMYKNSKNPTIRETLLFLNRLRFLLQNFIQFENR